jgi:glycosyltransferase involved in cell wall biosynthesis
MCYLTIVQDKRRAELLRADNNLERESIICVPDAGLGKAYRAKGNLLQEMCGIPQEKKVLLYAGYMAPWAMCLEMAEAAQNWRDDFVLVLHSWQEDIVNNPYITQIRRLTQTRKVYLSLKQVDWQKMPELVSSADIGLALYQNLGEARSEIGHSSNKLAQYLQMGLPVITTDYPSLRDVIDRYQCGACGSGPDSIEPLAEMIFDDYERYRANAFRCYENEYDFSMYFRKVIERIKDIETY